jgi:hypothetical protein
MQRRRKLTMILLLFLTSAILGFDWGICVVRSAELAQKTTRIVALHTKRFHRSRRSFAVLPRLNVGDLVITPSSFSNPLIADLPVMCQQLRIALPDRLINPFAGPLARWQSINLHPYAMIDVSSPDQVPDAVNCIKTLALKRVLWILPCTYGEYAPRLDCYPGGWQQMRDVVQAMKNAGAQVGLHTHSFLIQEGTEIANDPRVLRYGDRTRYKVPTGGYLPGPGLAGEIGRRCANAYLSLNCDGGFYLDAIDFLNSSVIEPSSGKPLCDNRAVIAEFRDAILTKIPGGCPIECSMPSTDWLFISSHFQAWDYPRVFGQFQDYIDRHRADANLNAGCWVRNYGWWCIDFMTSSDVIYGLRACQTDSAIYSLVIPNPTAFVQEISRNYLKINALRVWNLHH